MATQKTGAYALLGTQIVEGLGGEENIRGLTHCATRLRFTLKDRGKAQVEKIRQLDGVVTVVQAGGQHQVVIGNDVANVYDAIVEDAGLRQKTEEAEEASERTGTPFTRFVTMISNVFSPVIWTMAAVGLIKAFLALFTVGFPLIDTESQTYVILNALGDGFMFLLPVMLSVSAAKYFKVNYAVTMAIAAFLVSPALQTFYESGESVHLFGLPVLIAPYTYSVFPILVTAWVQSLTEPPLKRVIPSWMRNFTVPFLEIIGLGLATLLIIGPIITLTTNLVADGLTWIWGPAPWLGGFLLGGLWQVFVMFGLHWGIVPIFLQELSQNGYSLLFGPLPAAVTAQCAAALAVALRTRDKKLSQMALPTSISGFFSGVTEPLVYGVNLPLKRPFFIAIGAGAVGGAIAASGGSASSANVFASLLTLPAFLQQGNFFLQLVGVATAIIVAFFATFFFGVARKESAAPIPTEQTDAMTITDAPGETARSDSPDLLTPLAGRALPLKEVKDPVFSSEAMGSGLGIDPGQDPESGVRTVTAPADGTVVTALESGHAYGLRTDDGVELLIHIGINTVELNGRSFTHRVQQGQRVTAGQPLVDVDFAALGRAGYDTTVIMVITNSASFSNITPMTEGTLEAEQIAVVIQR